MGALQDSGIVSSFKEDEKAALRESWDIFNNSHQDAGVKILARFIINNPEAKKFFPKFKGLNTAEELQNSAEVRIHGDKILAAVQQAVLDLDDPDKQKNKLKDLSKSHAQQFNVEPAYFKTFAEVILKYVTETCGKSFTSEMRTSWSKLLSLIIIELQSAY
ncbi:globin-2-like [Petromyzon marinus]|uniref:Globin-2-like n=1 Tax=Petromyzon marinus TaxID=7757 RepID=A0AAJ7TFC2_PETMA|nr:globin-2-like [Petromyzon marinus]